MVFRAFSRGESHAPNCYRFYYHGGCHRDCFSLGNHHDHGDVSEKQGCRRGVEPGGGHADDEGIEGSARGTFRRSLGVQLYPRSWPGLMLGRFR
jgi:hypothetical protein